MSYLFIAFAVLHAAPVLLLIAAKLLSSSPRGAIAELMALADVSIGDRAAAVTCIDRAQAAEHKTFWPDVTAPVVVAYALLFTPRSADKLPAWARKWDNNVSLNGDGEAVYRDGRWLDLRNGEAARPGEHVYRYDDPLYDGKAYYCKRLHPRGFVARWVWVGCRNRASALSVSLGVDVSERPVCISGSTDIGRAKPGHFLLKCGDTYHYKSFRHWGALCLIRSYGAKLEYALYRPEGQFGRVPHIAIGRSYKGGKK